MPLRPEPQHPQGLDLGPQARESTLAAVDLALEASAAGLPEPSLPEDVPGPTRLSGIFVSLHQDGRLRGCMGRMGRPMPLGGVLMEVARLAACGDPRFPALTITELPGLAVEVWLLYGLARVEGPAPARVGQIRVGHHGVELESGHHHGVFLPCVAPEQGWDAKALLARLGQKAGLGEDAWLDPAATVRVFQGLRLARS
jgi:AmmeMemoRadiSam system protein A